MRIFLSAETLRRGNLLDREKVRCIRYGTTKERKKVISRCPPEAEPKYVFEISLTIVNARSDVNFYRNM